MRKYYGITETISNTIYRVEIWDAPSGSATGGTQLPMATPGFTLTYNQQGGKLWEDQIQTSKVQAQFIVKETADHTFFRNIAVEFEGNFALVVFKNNTLYYVGRIIADQMQYERRSELNNVYTSTAVDGLSMLSKFKVQFDWFDASTKRLSILDLIRLSIAETFVPDYYIYLGYTNTYIMDLSKDLPTGSPGHMKILEFNMSSTIANLSNIVNFNNQEDIFIDTQKAINELLKVTHSKLIYANGYFTIYDPITIAENNFIFAFVYSTAGVYMTRPTINTQYSVDDGVKPCFQAFPIYTHQPPQLKIEQTFVRKGFDFNFRKESLRSTSPMTLNYPSIGFLPGDERFTTIMGVFSFIIASFTAITPPNQQFHEINFRVYIDGGVSGYKHYDYQNQTWSAFQATIPFYERVRCEVTDYKVINSNYAQFTVDFFRNLIPPSSSEIIVAEVAMGNLTWSWGTGVVRNLVSFWGLLQIFEEASPRKVIVRNTKNINATEVLEESVVYGYNFIGNTLKGIGTIWNSSINAASDVTADDWATRQISVYIDAPKVAQAILVDDGGYHAMLCPVFDDESYVFNGGVFSAQDETWNFELLKIATDVVNIDTSELDNQDQVDTNDQQNNAVFRVVQQVETLRESVSHMPQSLPTDVVRLAVDSPTVQPTVITNFAPIIYYDTATEDLTWNIQELGKTQSLSAGTHALDTSAELILCNTSEATVIINLPAANTVKGRKYAFKKTTSSHSISLVGTVDGAPVYSITGTNKCSVIMSDGISYYVISE